VCLRSRSQKAEVSQERAQSLARLRKARERVMMVAAEMLRAHQGCWGEARGVSALEEGSMAVSASCLLAWWERAAPDHVCD
jgi:hypothetical protein